MVPGTGMSVAGVYSAGLAALLVALILTPLAMRLGASLGLIDVPNERSSHHTPAPRTGGIPILAAIAFATVIGERVLWEHVVLIVAAVLLGVLAVIDDNYELPRGARFLTQIAVAIAAITLTGFR